MTRRTEWWVVVLCVALLVLEWLVGAWAVFSAGAALFAVVFWTPAAMFSTVAVSLFTLRRI